MTMAVAMLGTEGRMQECRVLLDGLSQLGNLSTDVDRLVLCDPGDQIEGLNATLVPITADYSDLASKDPEGGDQFKKLFAFLMPYSRVVYLDSKLECTGSVESLWSESCLSQHLLYARHLPDGSFDDKLMVFNHDLLLGFHDILLYLIRTELFDGYGRTCRGLLNGYFYHTRRKVGKLPKGLNFR
jgi:hypothetical protein